jgi:hypothetical protein
LLNQLPRRKRNVSKKKVQKVRKKQKEMDSGHKLQGTLIKQCLLPLKQTKKKLYQCDRNIRRRKESDIRMEDETEF